MAGSLIPEPKQQFLNDIGFPLFAGKIYTYAAGTLTPKDTFQDPALTIKNTNPVIANARGEVVMYGSGAYRIILKDALDVTIWDRDNIETPDAASSQLQSSLFSSIGSSLVGFIQDSVNAVRRTLQDRLRDTVSVKDFGAKGDGINDDTDAFNKCFAYATANYRTVLCPDGEYLVSNLLFGNQSTTSQSLAPLGFVGQSREGCRLKVKPGTSGILFQGWSLAGVKFSDFTITTLGTAVQALNLDWKAGGGPSTQNQIMRIRVNGGTAGTHVSLVNLNDTYPNDLAVNATNNAQCCIDMRQAGGLVVMDNCIWSEGYIKLGCQNAKLKGCWGFGIEFSANAVNNVSIDGGYMYPNSWHSNGNFWSESFAPFQSVHSLSVGPGTQIITAASAAPLGVFNLNVLSSIEFVGVEFKSLGGAVSMWGPDCRRDQPQNSAVSFRGGSYDSTIALNNPGQFDIEYKAFINKETGYAYRNSYKNYFASGGNAGNFGSGTWYEFIPEATMVAGVYIVFFSWDHKGAGNPFLLNATAVITVTPITIGIPGSGVEILANIGEFRTPLQTQVKFRLTSTANPVTPKVEFQCSIPLPSPGVLTWSLTKIA